MKRPTVLVTRPAAQAGVWVDALVARGWPAVSVPLLSIEPAPDPAALQAARMAILQARPAPAAVMFVSPTAVQHFFADYPVAGSGTAPEWPATTSAVATGPGTAQALQQSGVPGGCIVQPPADAPAFDSEQVWPLLCARAWAGTTVWIVRGDGGRDWLADRWREAGAAVHLLPAYRRRAPQWSPAELARLQAACLAPALHAWLFSSSEGMRHLVKAEPASLAVPAIATHPAIAQAARACGFVDVAEATPTVDAVVACLESRLIA